MKPIFKIFLFALISFSNSVSMAESEVDISGQIRSRSEASQKSFHEKSEHAQTYTFLRSRVNIKALIDNNAEVFIQFQDSRRLGDSGQSSGIANNANVDLHQAFLKYNFWKKEKWSIGVLGGRFEFNWGNQRLLGAVGWHNIGRSWEGGLAWYNSKSFNLTLASLKALEKNNSTYNADFDVFAVTAKLKRLNLDFLLLLENDADTSSFTVPGIQNLERSTLAAYYKYKKDQLNMEFNLALQGGTMGNSDSTEIDIAALLFTGELGYLFKGDNYGQVAIAIDYASGDDDFSDNDWKVFNNLYWTGHKFNGYMDYFLSGGPNGLVDIILKGKIDITNGWTVGGDLHLFSAAEDYVVVTDTATSTTTSTKDIGTELDLFVKTNRVKGVELMWGASVFTPKENFAILQDMEFKNKKTAVWLYSQATVNF